MEWEEVKDAGGVQVRGGVRPQVKDVATGLLVLSQHLGLVNNEPQ